MKRPSTETLLSTIDFSSFYQKYLPELKTNGKNEVQVKCPFHEDHTASLSINVSSGLFNCFGCDAKGNVITFLEQYHDIKHDQAREMLYKEYGFESQKRDHLKKGSQKTQNFLNTEQVGRLHNQLLNSEPFLKQFIKTRGLTLETIKRYKLGLQNESILIPMELEPGRWTWKEHKGLQAKGNRVSIFPQDVLETGDTRLIIITEGEFDTLLLNQMGFLAVSGTAGAGTWKKEWNSLFENRNVILAYDNDDPGKKGAIRVAENLTPFARTVKAVTWPTEMNTSDCKDVTDYFVKMGKTKADFQMLLDRARNMGPEILEIEGIKFIQPPGFMVDANCIKASSMNREGIVTWAPVFFAPVFITSRAIDVDNGAEEVELTFKRDMKQRKLWISRRVMSDARKIVELADTGFPVNTENSRHMIKYLTAFEASNITFTPKVLIARGPGWKEIDGKTTFLLDARSNSIKQASEDDNVTIEFVADSGFERFVKAFTPQGSFAGWKEAVKPALSYHLAQFSLYASFTAPLIKILRSSNFLLDFWGNTSTGKTTVLELAASVWGNPHKETGGLVFSWDSTKVFLERMADFFCDIPIFPDDSQVVPDAVLRNTLYMIANGVGRGRGSTMGIRHTPTWHTVCFSTGERPLVECTTYAGAKARTIEIYGSPFPDCGGAFINTLKEGIRSNYGHAGSIFVTELSAIMDNPVKLRELKDAYNKYQRAYSDRARSEVGDRYSHYFAAVRVAADIAYKIIGVDDILLAEIAIDDVFRSLINDNMGELDTSTRALDFVISWINGNEAFFSSNNRESYGQWNPGDCVCIYPHKLKEVLLKEGFSDRAILKAWADKQWIQVNQGHHTVPKRLKKKTTDTYPLSSLSSPDNESESNRIQRFVAIQWNIFKQFSEQ